MYPSRLFAVMNVWGNGKIAGDDIMTRSQSSTKLAEEVTDENIWTN